MVPLLLSFEVVCLQQNIQASVSDSFCSGPWIFKKGVGRKKMLHSCHFHGDNMAKELQETLA